MEAERDSNCQETARQKRVRGKGYAHNNRGIFGSGVYYAVRAEAIYQETSGKVSPI
jgi:hypothetical protein